MNRIGVSPTWSPGDPGASLVRRMTSPGIDSGDGTFFETSRRRPAGAFGRAADPLHRNTNISAKFRAFLRLTGPRMSRHRSPGRRSGEVRGVGQYVEILNLGVRGIGWGSVRWRAGRRPIAGVELERLQRPGGLRVERKTHDGIATRTVRADLPEEGSRPAVLRVRVRTVRGGVQGR